MQPIDWILVGAVAVGAGAGSLIGYRLTRNRAPSPKSAVVDPAMNAALLAMAAFLGCSMAEDLVYLMGRDEPGGFFLAKYILAAATGIVQFARLRRSAIIQARRA